MEITFYYGSGSPYAWRVWLALEHKRVPYALRVLSFSAGELHTPEFLMLNPRHRVPVIVDGDFALFESVAILEYLDERYPEAPGLLPASVRQRAIVRRLLMEIDWYLAQAVERLVEQVLYTPAPARDAARIDEARHACAQELAYFEEMLRNDFLAGEFGAADIALYPLLALLRRLDGRPPGLRLAGSFGPALMAWMARIEALPYFARTYPPHWRETAP